MWCIELCSEEWRVNANIISRFWLSGYLNKNEFEPSSLNRHLSAMPIKKGKTARFQVDQVGDTEEVVVEDDHMLTTKSDAVHFTQYHKYLRHYLMREVLPLENNYRNLLSIGRNSIRGKTEERLF